MTSSRQFRRFAFAYGLAFAMSYVVVLKLDLALFTVYPTIGVVLLGTHHSRDTVAPSMGSFLPAMYWYGWTATAALAALIFGCRRRVLARALRTMVLVGVGVDDSRGGDDRLPLPHPTVVSTLASQARRSMQKRRTIGPSSA